ncbi:unnamed protein product [Oikopleura dioica]|uniref:Uncharacterized protein n=1 Tax=Oikopleura dioica TaxID=34765 RepID=E4Y375_OIKDI|nr:unnamed protein product [Oikopleura dioica]
MASIFRFHFIHIFFIRSRNLRRILKKILRLLDLLKLPSKPAYAQLLVSVILSSTNALIPLATVRLQANHSRLLLL